MANYQKYMFDDFIVEDENTKSVFVDDDEVSSAIVSDEVFEIEDVEDNNVIKEEKDDNEIESLMEKLVDANDTLLKYINKRIVELDNAKKQILSDLNTLTLSQNNITNSKTIVDHVDKWDKLSFDDKRSVVDALIDKIMVSDESVEINWKI